MMWLVRISLDCLAAAGMGVVGLALLPVASLRHPGYAWAAAVSVVLWLCLSPLVYRQSLGTAISVGLMSPLIAMVVGSPLAVLALFFDMRYWVVFPTGASAGVLVRACLSIGQESERGKREHAGGVGPGGR